MSITTDDMCVCGHSKLGHHELCNGRNRKRWCDCRKFKPRCPNIADPVLCKWFDGQFIPEAGCPAHDPNPEASE